MSEEYNGWKNFQTASVGEAIQNDERIYNQAVEYVARCRKRGKKPRYSTFVMSAGLEGGYTFDGVAYSSHRLSKTELNELLDEIDK